MPKQSRRSRAGGVFVERVYVSRYRHGRRRTCRLKPILEIRNRIHRMSRFKRILGVYAGKVSIERV